MSREFIRTEDLGMWIEGNIEDKNTYPEVMEAVFWFIACQEASVILSSYTTKDMAGMLLGGAPKIENSQEYVDNYLDTLYDDSTEEEIEEANKLLIENLKTHFGLK